MLMLYLFKVEVFDLSLNYAYSTDCTVIARTQDDRRRLLNRQFGDHNRSIVKRAVLLGARALTCGEAALLEGAVITAPTLWLTIRLSRGADEPGLRRLPRIQSGEEMYDLLERIPQKYDSSPLEEDQYVHGKRFFHEAPNGTHGIAA